MATRSSLLCWHWQTTHCNILQHTVTPCNTLQRTGRNGVATRSSLLCQDWLTTHCNTLQHPATHCNTLQHTETHRPQWGGDPPKPRVSVLAHSTVTHCNTLQHTATPCNTQAAMGWRPSQASRVGIGSAQPGSPAPGSPAPVCVRVCACVCARQREREWVCNPRWLPRPGMRERGGWGGGIMHPPVAVPPCWCVRETETETDRNVVCTPY